MERWAIAREHVQAVHEFYGETGVRIARKHVQWYLGRMDLQAETARRLGRSFNALDCPRAQLDFLDYHAEALAA
jgi:tRNA-dihydrouridine synthase B